MIPGSRQACTHGVTQLLTVNIRDFQRFPLLRIVHPVEVVRST
jgi:hypothetical protein